MHISDLHRDSGSQITTTALLRSLGRDCARYTEREDISRPDLAVVSGDIIYGVKAEEKDADQKLQAQYDEAHNFLVALADQFFAGDRERVILVPGNHDVSMMHVERAITKVPIPEEANKKSILASQLLGHDSKFRWRWADFSALEITNPDLYEQRLEPYARFYNRFYNGRRSFLIAPSDQFSVHDFPSLGICFIGLSSCHDNDIYNRTGRVHPDALAQAMDAVNPYVRKGRLAIGVWHHSIQGGPRETDYVDSDLLQALMDGNCSIGMHGHQHRPQLLEHRFTADRKRSISIISAGTLCGGPRSLPAGRMRGYNLVTLDTEQAKGTIHVRHMVNSDFSSPVWGASYVTEFGGTSIDFELPESAVQVVQPLAIAGEADQLLRSGDPSAAYEMIKSALDHPILRIIAVSALADMGDWKEITKVFKTPQSPAEFILLSEAYEELGNWDAMKLLHTSDFAQSRPDSAVKQRIEMCHATLMGKK
ncbi:metallophosphoesterase [Pseudomonas sp. ZB1P45]|uniref:metallophosphoesterase n=1 Tax=Pseudomonas frigoris TaxID=3398356 RepID=UPI0039EF5E20